MKRHWQAATQAMAANYPISLRPRGPLALVLLLICLASVHILSAAVAKQNTGSKYVVAAACIKGVSTGFPCCCAPRGQLPATKTVAATVKKTVTVIKTVVNRKRLGAREFEAAVESIVVHKQVATSDEAIEHRLFERNLCDFNFSLVCRCVRRRARADASSLRLLVRLCIARLNQIHFESQGPVCPAGTVGTSNSYDGTSFACW